MKTSLSYLSSGMGPQAHTLVLGKGLWPLPRDLRSLLVGPAAQH